MPRRHNFEWQLLILLFKTETPQGHAGPNGHSLLHGADLWLWFHGLGLNSREVSFFGLNSGMLPILSLDRVEFLYISKKSSNISKNQSVSKLTWHFQIFSDPPGHLAHWQCAAAAAREDLWAATKCHPFCGCGCLWIQKTRKGRPGEYHIIWSFHIISSGLSWQ